MCDEQLWIFGYGSLMWHPDFAYTEREIATLANYRRAFLMRSVHHRGTPERPGLVLALDRAEGAACSGLAFRIKPGCEDETMVALRARELVSYAYKEQRVAVSLADGRQIAAITYVIDQTHPQYCGALPLQEQARIIATASGGRGANHEYLFNTQAHLAKLGIEDDEMDRLAQAVRAQMAGHGEHDAGARAKK